MLHLCSSPWPFRLTAALSLLQDQALSVLQTAADQFENPAFPCALIAGVSLYVLCVVVSAVQLMRNEVTVL